MWISVLLGLPLALVVGLAASPIARVLGASGEVADFAVTYLQISAVAVPFVVLTLAAEGVLRGAADYHTPLLILLTANILNAVLEVWMVFGLDLGIPGSAWSTVICQIGAALAFAWVIRRRLAPASVRRPDWAGMAPLLTAGRHLLLRVGAMLAVLSGATAVAARIDAPTLAAHQIAASIFILVALVLDALAVPAQTLVADDLGRGERPAAAELARRAVRLSVITAVAIGLLLAVTAPVLPRLFTTDDAVATRASSALWILAVAVLPAAVAFAHDGVLIGAADYRFLGVAAARLPAVRRADRRHDPRRTISRHRRDLARPHGLDGPAGGRQRSQDSSRSWPHRRSATSHVIGGARVPGRPDRGLR